MGGAPLLEVERLAVDYIGRDGRRTRAVAEADFAVARGEVVALVGESGSGKSTTAHAILGLLGRNGQIAGGAIRFLGQDIAGLPERRLRPLRGRHIALVPQDPTVSLNPVLRIGRQIGDVAVIHGLVPRQGAEAYAIEVLQRVGIPQPELRVRQYPHELSGGMRQRILIGMALVCKPDLVVADEPTSALDVTVQRRVLDLLAEMTAETGSSVLLITHDLGVAADRAQRVVVMRKGVTVEQGPAARVLTAPEHDYTRQMVAAAPSIATWKSASLISPEHVAATAGNPVLVEVAGLSRRFGSGPRAIQAVAEMSFTIRKGQTLALVGESGSGKSTVSRMVAGLTVPSGGTIRVGNEDISTLRGESLRQFRRNVQMVYQNPYASLDPRMVVSEIVREPLRAFGLGTRAAQLEKVEQLLVNVGLAPELGRRRPAELSGGQRQRVAIARSLALEPALLILDEPVSALDVSVQSQILRLLVELQERLSLTYLFVSHDLAVVRLISDHVAVMQAGRLVEMGTATDVFNAPATDYARQLVAAIPGQRHAAA